jgi:hypothetical protein
MLEYNTECLFPCIQLPLLLKSYSTLVITNEPTSIRYYNQSPHIIQILSVFN